MRIVNILFMFQKTLLIAILGFALIFSFNAKSASPDAIAVRVLANPKHYSAAVWYKKQGFKGSPQSITVDGYNGIRDGRTVYVNAANIPDYTAPAYPKLYTNIYLISYNQSAESATVDIFGQILEHWKFNSNQNEAKICSLKNTVNCIADEDCGSGDYCLSMKAMAKRDVRRLEDLAEIDENVIAYNSRKGFYPKLQAGTYVKGYSLSVWPSWKDTLAKELGATLPVDPINALSPCGDDPAGSIYNVKTCWDEKNKHFADSNLGDPALNLPDFSRAYLYSGNDKGNTYKLCASGENVYSNAAELNFCSSGSINHVPVITASCPLTDTKNMQYDCFVTASDVDGDDFNMDVSGLPAGILKVMSGTKVTGLSGKPTVAGDFTVSITAQETKTGGLLATYKFNLKIFDVFSAPPLITLPPTFTSSVYEKVVGKMVDFAIVATDSDGIKSFALSGASLPPGLSVTESTTSGTYQISGIVSTAFPVASLVNLDFILTVKDNLDNASTISFTIRLTNTAPVITSVVSI